MTVIEDRHQYDSRDKVYVERPFSRYFADPLNMLKRTNSILIVEDEDIIRSSLREFLQDEGYDVAVAGSVVYGLVRFPLIITFRTQ